MRYILLATLLVLALVPLNAAASANGRGPCTAERYEVHASMTATKQRSTVRKLIRWAVRRWAVEGGAAKAISVAECESSLYTWANNGTYEGLYQIGNWPGARSTWLAHRHWMFPRWVNTSWKPSALNERANVFVAIRWAHALGWAAWACA